MIHVICYFNKGTRDLYHPYGQFKLPYEVLGQIALDVFQDVFQEGKLLPDPNVTIVTKDGVVILAVSKKPYINRDSLGDMPYKYAPFSEMSDHLKGMKSKFMTAVTNFKKHIGGDDMIDVLNI